jgi:hypothetical protein
VGRSYYIVVRETDADGNSALLVSAAAVALP